MSTNITKEHRAAFEALISADYDNFALTPGMVITDHDGRPCGPLKQGQQP